MSISRIRGEQIKLGVIKDEHINLSAAIAESKLNIDWMGHYHSALAVKKVVDFVQVNGSTVSGSSFVISSLSSEVVATSSDEVEGVLTDSPKNFAPIRSAVTGDPIVDGSEREVYGRVVSENGDFVLKFFVKDGASEVVYSMPSGTVIDWQYAKRFNLDVVSEMFAMNEKFVDGAADATAHLNINQIARDVYGNSFTLDRDGNANLGTSIVDQIANEITARQAAIDGVYSAFGDSTSAANGANLVGVYDADGKFVASNVNDALIELYDKAVADKSDLESQLANLNTDLAADLAAEIASREAADTLLTTNLNTEIADRIAAVSAEQAAREADVADLQAQLDQEILDRAAAVSAEESARIAAVSAEQSARIADVADLQAQLDQEILDRAAADSNEASLRTAADVTLQSNIDAEQAARIAGDATQATALQTFKDDLNSAVTGKGAELVKVDGGSGLTGSTVQDVLEDFEFRVAYLEDNGGAEVTATHTRDAATTNGVFAVDTFASLEERLDDIESTVDAKYKELVDADTAEASARAAADTTLQTNITTEQNARIADVADLQSQLDQEISDRAAAVSAEQSARQTADSTLQANITAEENARIAAVSAEQTARETADGVLQDNIDAEQAARESADSALDARVTTLEASKHDHFKGVYQVTSNVDSISISSFGSGLPNYTVANNSLHVYVNGILQNEGLHYGEVAGGASIDFDPTNDGTVLIAGDIVTIIYHNA